MFTTLIKVLKEQADAGIYHTRANGEFVQELFTKDADLVYEVNDFTSTCYGEQYAMFIIEAEDGDKVRYCGWDHNLGNHDSFDKYKVYWDSRLMERMYMECFHEGKPMLKKWDNLLRDKLSVFFSETIYEEEIDEEDIWFDSETIWYTYSWILDSMGEKAADYVPQETIDKFLSEYMGDISI